MGRPAGSQNKDKPFREALRMQLAEAGNDLPALREVAKALISKASGGDVQAIREVADRLDGRPAQSIDVAGHLHSRPASELSDDELAAVMTAGERPQHIDG